MWWLVSCGLSLNSVFIFQPPVRYDKKHGEKKNECSVEQATQKQEEEKKTNRPLCVDRSLS